MLSPNILNRINPNITSLKSMGDNHQHKFNNDILFLAIYDSIDTPNLVSIKQHLDWYTRYISSMPNFSNCRIDTKHLDTRYNVNEYLFTNDLSNYLMAYRYVYIYICEHGIIKDNTFYLKINKDVLISNDTISNILVKYPNYELTIFLDVCHGEKFFNTNVLNNKSIYNIRIFNTANEDEKDYILKTKHSYGTYSQSVITNILKNCGINPLFDPHIAKECIKKYNNLKNHFSVEIYTKY